MMKNGKSIEEWNEIKKEGNRRAAKAYRDYLSSLSPEGLEEYKYNKECDKARRKEARREKEELKTQKILNKRELAILEYMKASGVLYYHHSKSDKLFESLDKGREYIKSEGTHLVYHPYFWNHNEKQSSYMPVCLLGRLWNHSDFTSIYDVPLDGSWIFYAYDAGERGLGSFQRISAYLKGELPYAPNVYPGYF